VIGPIVVVLARNMHKVGGLGDRGGSLLRIVGHCDGAVLIFIEVDDQDFLVLKCDHPRLLDHLHPSLSVSLSLSLSLSLSPSIYTQSASLAESFPLVVSDRAPGRVNVPSACQLSTSSCPSRRLPGSRLSSLPSPHPEEGGRVTLSIYPADLGGGGSTLLKRPCRPVC